ncbi:MAG: hypothetical protein ACK41D_08530 [Rubricoccaceae bacterium]
MPRFLALLLTATAALGAGLLASGCDSSITGTPYANQPPTTQLSVRVADLRETLDGTLTSTVEAAWSGTDPDGLVVAYEVRTYDASRLGQIGPEELWSRTTRRDSTILLRIPPGQSTAAVALEVRAIDDRGAKDPNPARTVFPVRNSPPALALARAEAPADTTWPVFSFAYRATDPDGPADLAGVEVAFNQTDTWTRLPPGDFVTFVAENPRATGETGARVFLGRGFQNAGLTVPGLRLGAANVVYFRAADAAEATSPVVRFPQEDTETFFVRAVRSDVLLVNDFRATAAPVVMGFHREALRRYGTTTWDEWDLSRTPQTANNPRYSAGLPASADPTLRQTLALWPRIYWVSNAATNRTRGNNLPLAASVMDLFFQRGGRLLVQVPISLPLSGDESENAGNAALNILPLQDLIALPQGSTALRVRANTPLRPDAPVPGGAALPALRATQVITGALPYVTGFDDVPLYRVQFFDPRNNQDWTGSDVVASLSGDRRVGLFALTPVSTATGAPLYVPAEPGGPDLYDAFARLLAGLDFPR